MNPLPAILGAIALLILFGFFAAAIWRLCNGERASAAQSSQMTLDDDGAELTRYVITYSPAVICNEHGMWTVNERGEWVPFEGGR